MLADGNIACNATRSICLQTVLSLERCTVLHAIRPQHTEEHVGTEVMIDGLSVTTTVTTSTPLSHPLDVDTSMFALLDSQVCKR